MQDSLYYVMFRFRVVMFEIIRLHYYKNNYRNDLTKYNRQQFQN